MGFFGLAWAVGQIAVPMHHANGIMRMAKKRIMRITLEIAVPMHPENHFGNGLQISNRFGGLGLAWSPPGVGPPIELKVAISNLLQVRYFHFKPADVVFSSRLM